VTLKKVHIPGTDVVISKGAAEVFYVKKEDAGVAIQKLYFESELGDNLTIDFYKLKEARISEHDK
jgi:hypothetical protein